MVLVRTHLTNLVQEQQICAGVRDKLWYTWKCKHYTPDIPEDRIDWFTHADARGSACPDPAPTSEASSRGYAARNDCPHCRSGKTKAPSDLKVDGDAGVGGAGSATTGQSTDIVVGA